MAYITIVKQKLYIGGPIHLTCLVSQGSLNGRSTESKVFNP